MKIFLECEEFAKLSKIDIYPSHGFVGGTTTEVSEFPHMTAIGTREGNETTWVCGGSLISENFVMTAAHCVPKPSAIDRVVIRIGDKNLHRDDDGASPQNFRIKKVYKHPEYHSSTKYNDIALLELDKSAT